MMRKLSVMVLATCFVGACADEPPDPTSRLDRPSGLAYVMRDADRADLFVADAEAGGVRVLQLQSDGTGTFVPAPTLFFPLAIPSGDFPSDIAASSDGNRIYALSPVGRKLFVLDTREAPFDYSATEVDTYVPLAEVDLDVVRDGFSLGGLLTASAIPVAIAVLPGGTSQSDRVLVLYDRVTEPEGVILLMSFVLDPDPRIDAVQTATVGPGARGLKVRTEPPVGLLVSSAASSTVSFIPTTDSSSASFGRSQSLNAGGPTLDVIDAGPAGAVALRLDRSSVAVFDVVGDRLQRSTRSISSPFTPEDERGDPDAIGRIDMFPRALSTGAAGQVDRLAFSENFPEDQDLVDVVAVIHVDASISFLLGNPLELSLSNRAQIEQVDRLVPDGVGVVECQEVEAETCPLPADAMCADTVLPDKLTLVERYRFEYEGVLATENAGELRGAGTSSTGAPLFDLRDYRRGPFPERQVEAGHAVLLQYKGPSTCEGEEIVEVVDTGSIVSVHPSIPELTVRLSEDSPFLAVALCPDRGLELARYQVYPPGQIVFTRKRADLLDDTVVDILAVQSAPSGGEQVVVDEEIALTLAAPQGFRCVQAGAAEPSSSTRCTSVEDCGGASCRVAALADGTPDEERASRVCRAFCNACAELDDECFRSFQTRRCSGVEIQVNHARATRTDPDDFEEGLPVSVLPDDMVFSPIRASWMFSMPGARSLGEVRTIESEDGSLLFGTTGELR